MADKKPDDMSEDELARFYESRMGDDSLWEKKPRQIRTRRGGASTVFSLRLAPEELEELYQAARREGSTLSDFVRKGALDRARAVRS
jgi:hypothetical protein